MFPKTAVLALAAVAALGQTPRPAGEYVGAVTGDNVYVRSGPGDSYPCTKLSRPATVQVVDEQFGWLKILPPKGCYSLISNRYVKADGNVGTVRGTNILVRAGSSLYPDRREAVQTRLNVGEKVMILGSSGDYYMIVPPRRAYLWISSQYVKAVPGVAPRTRPAGPTTREVPVPPVGPRLEETPRVVVTRKPAGEVAKDVAAFEAAEAALNEEFQKPRGQRDLQALLKRYQALAGSGGGTLAPFVEARIKYIQSEIELANDLKDVETLLAGVKVKQDKLAAETKGDQVPTPRLRRMYAAEGLLAESRLFQGGPTGPKRYTVSDPDTRVIYAYVQCITGGVNLQEHVKPPAPAPVAPKPPEVKEPAPPATQPAEVKEPLPTTGLPVAEPSTKPAVNPDEYE